MRTQNRQCWKPCVQKLTLENLWMEIQPTRALQNGPSKAVRTSSWLVIREQLTHFSVSRCTLFRLAKTEEFATAIDHESVVVQNERG